MSRDATARLFVAVDPPPEVGGELAAWGRAVAAAVGGGGHGPRGGMRVLAADTLHLTLCFLGSRPTEEIDALGSALSQCSEHRCELSMGAPLWLPPRHPRALAVEIHDADGELGRLQGELTRALAQVSGWEPERRRFRAHITVARLRPGARVGRGVEALAPTPSAGFAPRSLVLYRSWLSPKGARYEPLASCELEPGSAG